MVSQILAKEKAAMDEAGGPLEILYFGGGAIFESMVQDSLRGDAMFALGSIVFVLLYLWFHTSSFFLASLGMLHIVLSFPVSYFWLRIVFGIRYFDMMNIFLLYIIMGIG
jgi:hypothetical protein